MVGGGNGGEGEQAPPSTAARHRISPRPRASIESGHTVTYSPGPMTMLSSFFGDGDECKSFSELLAGAMVDPTMPSNTFNSTSFLDSPSQGHLGMTHQQMLAQITSQAVPLPAPSNVQIQAEHSFFIPGVHATTLTQLPTATFSTPQQLIPPPVQDSEVRESLDYSHSDQKLQSSSVNADKPNDDGYNWRKYGQKNVKGSDFSRSYYKCTHPKCPVKKKLERSLEGHVTAIIYKGEHNHPNKLIKDTLTSNENSDTLKEEIMSSHSVEHESGTSDSDEVAGDHETEVDEKNDEPHPKRRNTKARLQDPAYLQKVAAEPRIIVQTTSDVDLLDDGYRWRKYGQKVVKGNPYPRSYYKCTTQGCNVRKHVERASTDPKAVITTYEGKHNHDVPVAKTNSHTLANNSASHSQLQAQNVIPVKHSFSGASLRLKEEQIT